MSRTDPPAHVALILDGNRRWARQRGKSHEAGYRAGMATARSLIEYAAKRGIPALTLFAFSSENRQRPKRQVDVLMELLLEALQKQASEMLGKGVQLRFIGQIDELSPELRSWVRKVEAQVPDVSRMVVSVALHYGGRQDLLSAFERCRHADGPVGEDQITGALGTGGLPDPDLLIRTGGERRLSNFLLWQLAYTELYFTDCLWPDFDESAFDQALEWFEGRDRRYGGSAG